MSSLPFEVPYHKIKRGKIYLVGFPFDDGRPLTFVEEDGDGQYQLTRKDYGFEPGKTETGRSFSPEVKIVVPHKAKFAVVLQCDEYNNDTNWHYTMVAPIDSIGPRERQREIIQRAMSRNDLDRIHHITCTGQDALIEITKMRRSHKNLIFQETRWELSQSDIDDVLIKISSILKVEKIPACAECETNCDNCELKAASSQ